MRRKVCEKNQPPAGLEPRTHSRLSRPIMLATEPRPTSNQFLSQTDINCWWRYLSRYRKPPTGAHSMCRQNPFFGIDRKHHLLRDEAIQGFLHAFKVGINTSVVLLLRIKDFMRRKELVAGGPRLSGKHDGPR